MVGISVIEIERKTDVTTMSVRSLIEVKNPQKKVLEAKYMTTYSDIKLYEFTYLYKDYTDICRDILLISPDRNLYCVCSTEQLAGIAVRYVMDFDMNLKEHDIEYYKTRYTVMEIAFYAGSKYGIKDSEKFSDLYPSQWLKNGAFSPLCIGHDFSKIF